MVVIWVLLTNKLCEMSFLRLWRPSQSPVTSLPDPLGHWQSLSLRFLQHLLSVLITHFILNNLKHLFLYIYVSYIFLVIYLYIHLSIFSIGMWIFMYMCITWTSKSHDKQFIRCVKISLHLPQSFDYRYSIPYFLSKEREKTNI